MAVGAVAWMKAMPILGPDLTYQMLAQRLLAVRPEIIVEISEP